MFAVVAIGGHQYTVAPGDSLVVDRLEGEVGKTLEFDRVLLISDEKKTNVGTPTISGTKVKARIVAQEKGEKLDVFRYKSKVRYRKHIGFRPHVTKLEILSIG